MGIQAAPADQAMPEGTAGGVMDHLNSGYLQLGLFALAFGGLQLWWISSTLRTSTPTGFQPVIQRGAARYNHHRKRSEQAI